MSDDLPATPDDVGRAAATIRGHVRRTPLLDAGEIGAGVRIKAELFQHAGSFKARGVVNRLTALDEAERARGVITVSAGNHAGALAWGAARERIDCVVVIYAGASRYKVERARAYGATIELVEGDPVDAFDRMEQIVAETGRIVIHPFDDPVVMAGQGTVGAEILEDAADTDVIVVPVGGGGLVAGIAAAVTPRGVRVVGVEPEGSAALRLALEAGEPVRLRPETIAGGLDAPYAGTNALAVCQACSVESVLVTDAEIEAATRRLYADVKLACEPAGAAGLAAVLAGRVDGERVAVVVSGGNVGAETASAILAGR
jgi:threonine dehydratase